MYRVFLVAVLLLAVNSCTAQQPPQSEYRPTATVKDLMDSVVDPGADFLWDAVSTRYTLEGTIEKAPKTDDEWAMVRHHAIMLIEATNMLLVPGRQIAQPGQKADETQVELPPEKIQALVDQDRATWTKHAHDLHDAAMVALKAVDNKSSEDLLLAGEGIDQACEQCHLKYWYPDEKQPTQ